MSEQQVTSFTSELWNKKITANVTRLDNGCAVLLTGGEKSHVGAVTFCDEDGECQSLTGKGHKELVLTEKWAKAIYEIAKQPVTVAAGIHYDSLTPMEISEVVRVTDELFEKVTAGF